jgi:hypothetical protein
MDKHYKRIMNQPDFIKEMYSLRIDRIKNMSFEEWARYAAKNIIPYYEEDSYRVEKLRYRILHDTDGEYELALDYWGGYANKILVRHNSAKCKNNEFWVSSYSFLNQKSRCPVCKESAGEFVIRKFLEKNKIHFKSQFCFSDLKGKNNRPLPFDFAIFDKHKKTIIHH